MSRRKTLILASICILGMFGCALQDAGVACASIVSASGPAASTDVWQLTGQIGGTAKALLREDDTLYLGVGLHVLVLDVSDPKKIQVVGTSPLLPQFVESIAGDAKGHLFVSCGSGGLVILDVSTPCSPTILGSLNTRGLAEGLALNGRFAVLADGPQGVQIVDISNLREPVLIAEAYPVAYAYDVTMQGNVAYVAAGGSGLLVVDLSDPKAPQEKGLIRPEGFQYDVEVAGGQLYAAGAWGGVSALSLAKPLEPVIAGTTSTTGWAMALSVQDSNLLVMDGADGALLYDISGQRPALKSTYTMGGFVLAGALGGTTSFLLDKEKGLMAVDFSDRSSPKLVSRWMPILDGRRVTMSGNTGYVAGGLSGMHVIDLSNRDNPTETYWYDTDGGYANKVVVDGTTAYLSTHLATRFPLVTFDVSDPCNPKKLGAVPNDETVFNTAFRSMTLDNGHIYIPGEFADASVDVSNPKNPKVVNRIDMQNPINAASSGNLLITTNSYQLQLVDISNPANMRLISTLDKNTSGEAITFIDPTTVITAADPGIWIVDVSNPRSPQKKADLALSGSVMDICIDGAIAYLSTLGNGVQIVDISNPLKPVRQGSVTTPGVAYDCHVRGDLMLVADSLAGLTIYQRKPTSLATTGTTTANPSSPSKLPLLLSEGSAPSAPTQPNNTQASKNPGGQISRKVTSAADSGPGTLRACLEKLQAKTKITFDPGVFPPKKPTTIQLKSPLPEITTDSITIDASNAGVILDGSKLTTGNGLTIYSSYSKIMGLQILHFPQHGIEVQGRENQIGGSRKTGSGPIGQGNLTSGNRLYGIRVGGMDQVVVGNLVGTNASGTMAIPNYDGIFVSDWAFRVTVGGANPGEGNLISGNQFINLDTWGDHTRIIGNIIGLNITGTQKLEASTSNNLVMESGAMNTVVGGKTPAERNIVSGASLGIVFSDPNSYQNSVIGNYIGTDITGTKAIPNQTGVVLWTSGNHRVGGAAEGERNLISGNQTGIELNGYGVTDNIILGNWIGVDASGREPLPNDTGISLNMGQRHAVIGGYTPEEGNLISGGSLSIRITNPGIVDNYIAGNTILKASVAGVYFEDHSSDSFVQRNAFGEMTGCPVRVDYGTGIEIRGNTFTGAPENSILLLEKGNLELPAPVVKAANRYSVSGTTCANGRVEVYVIEEGQIAPLGFADADANGGFTFRSSRDLGGKKVVLLTTDAFGNTSAFSRPYLVTAG